MCTAEGATTVLEVNQCLVCGWTLSLQKLSVTVSVRLTFDCLILSHWYYIYM